jgi:hypothetical protein
MKRLLLIALSAGAGLLGWQLGKSKAKPSFPPAAAIASAEANPTQAASLLILRQDPAGLLALSVSQYPDRLRAACQFGWQDEIGWLAERWAARDPAGLFAFMLAPEGLNFFGSVGVDASIETACFREWFRRDLPAAMVGLKQLLRYSVSNGRVDGSRAQSGVRQLFAVAPEEGWKFLADHSQIDIGVTLDRATLANNCHDLVDLPDIPARGWILTQTLTGLLAQKNGGDTAKAWLAKLAPDARLQLLADSLTAGDPFAAKPQMDHSIIKLAALTSDEFSALEQCPAGRKRAALLDAMTKLKAALDPTEAANWAMGTLHGIERMEAMRSILALSAPDNPAEAIRFLEPLTPGPLRDDALQAIATKIRGSMDQSAAADWAISLAEPKDQQLALKELMPQWTTSNPDACAAWILNAPESIRVEALKAAFGHGDSTSQMKLAAQFPEALALEALETRWRQVSSYSDSRSLAVAAEQLPAGALREAVVAKASKFSVTFFNYSYNDNWLDWASSLPTAADRAAAFNGATEAKHRQDQWPTGMLEKARQKLLGPGQ